MSPNWKQAQKVLRIILALITIILSVINIYGLLKNREDK